MKTSDQLSTDKLRGGYYTDDAIVDLCCRLLRDRLPRNNSVLRVLEPSAGDGAFLRGLDRNRHLWSLPQIACTAVEIDHTEAAKARLSCERATIDCNVIADSFFRWATLNTSRFDAVIGNPPFVRYQLIDKSERALAEKLLNAAGLSIDGVSNLWIPIILLALDRLRLGGAFAMVVPGEFLATRSAAAFRDVLTRTVDDLEVHLCRRGSFVNALQDTVVVAGRKVADTERHREVRLVEYGRSATTHWCHTLKDTGDQWRSYLLTKAELESVLEAQSASVVKPLGEIASFKVSIVTGANRFFTVDDETRDKFGLSEWALPLLARTEDAPGLVFRMSDWRSAVGRGKRVWFLDFADDRPNPLRRPAVASYISRGEDSGLNKRYKCRIRTPWYRVDDRRPGQLLMPKRAHRFHRIIMNDADVLTTDTIYRGYMRSGYESKRRDLVACFHNSLTMLSAELNGRTYGGGVLELVPSETSRLAIPLVKCGRHLSIFDRQSRQCGGQLDSRDILITSTDEMLSGQVPDYGRLLPSLRSSLARLRHLRLTLP